MNNETTFITTILVALLVFVPSYLQSRNGAANALTTIIQELRNEVAVLKKDKIELEAEKTRLENKVRDAYDERDAYASNVSKLRRIARRYAPRDTEIPEVEINGTTPPDGKA